MNSANTIAKESETRALRDSNPAFKGQWARRQGASSMSWRVQRHSPPLLKGSESVGYVFLKLRRCFEIVRGCF